jgi:hypothetical protein
MGTVIVASLACTLIVLAVSSWRAASSSVVCTAILPSLPPPNIARATLSRAVPAGMHLQGVREHDKDDDCELAACDEKGGGWIHRYDVGRNTRAE